MAQSKKDREKSVAETVQAVIDSADEEIPEREPETIAVDYEAWLAAAEAEEAQAEPDAQTRRNHIDAKVKIPAFRMEEGTNVLREDPVGTPTWVRLTPYLNSNQTAVVMSYRGGLNLPALPNVFAALVHPDDVWLWLTRINDLTRPVPHEWLLVAIPAILPRYGLAEASPGKAAS